MTFKVVETYWDIQNDGYYLVHSNWDDWFKYETTYLFYIKRIIKLQMWVQLRLVSFLWSKDNEFPIYLKNLTV